jgi:predicted transcriptional regulator of viral defense system
VRDREATEAIRELAERQHGVASRRQLVELGVGPEAVRSRLKGGFLVRLHTGVYAVGHTKLSRSGNWMSAVLAAGPNAFLSHASAMHLWGLRGSSPTVEVLRRSGGRIPSISGIRVHQTRRLLPEEHDVERGIPVTTVERTLVDMAARLDGRQLEHAVVAADRAGLIRWSAVDRLLGKGRGKKGIAKLRRVFARVDPRAVETRSPLEIDFLIFCRENELPTPQVNVLVEGHLVDFFWPLTKVIVETDSFSFHGNRISFEKDLARSLQLTRLGYRVHRVTDRMLSDEPDLVTDLIRDSLHRRTASDIRSVRTNG